MSVTNTDLLPPLFDQILDYFDVKRSGALVREDIVKGLESGIINAAASFSRAAAAKALRPQSAPPTAPGTANASEPVSLGTSDRLSGADLSRAALVQQLQGNVDLSEHSSSLNTSLIEIALLLIEAQIDLRLTGAESFRISGITFSRGPGDNFKVDAAEWCRTILTPAIQGATDDRPAVWSGFRKRKPAGIRVLIDTIQLSATLRIASPYRISVDWHLVEPLLAAPRNQAGIRLLHVSDLHLTSEIDEAGRKLVTPIAVPTHSFEAARYVASAVAALQPRFDAMVATGDLTTDGARGSFETVLQYVQSGSITGANPMRIAAYGLNASRSQRILLPGNHDRYAGQDIPGQRMDFTFEDVLRTPRGYPYMLGYRPHGRPNDSLTLLFLVFDSCLQAGRDGPRYSAKHWVRALAKGEVKDEELDSARALVAATVAARQVERTGGGTLDFEPAKTIRIALLHHHPVTKFSSPPSAPQTTPTLGQRFRAFFVEPVERYAAQRTAEEMAMENADKFLECCLDCGIQFALFGHQHYPYQRLVTRTPAMGVTQVTTPFGPSPGYLRAFCCPTTLQYDAPANGFYVFDFVSEAQVDWTLYGSRRVEGTLSGAMQPMQQRTFDISAPPEAAESEQQYAV